MYFYCTLTNFQTITFSISPTCTPCVPSSIICRLWILFILLSSHNAWLCRSIRFQNVYDFFLHNSNLVYNPKSLSLNTRQGSGVVHFTMLAPHHIQQQKELEAKQETPTALYTHKPLGNKNLASTFDMTRHDTLAHQVMTKFIIPSHIWDNTFVFSH